MNYIQILQDSLCVLRTQKLIWIFGFISMVGTFPSIFEKFVRGNLLLVCIYLTIIFPVLLIAFIAEGGLVYLVNQTILSRNLTFTDTWYQSRARIKSLTGFGLLAVPVMMVAIIPYLVIYFKTPTSPFLWLITIILNTFIEALYIFGLCAIMIDEIKALDAAWTSLLITLNNYFRLFVIFGAFFVIRLLVIVLVFAILTSGLFKFEPSFPLAFNFMTYQKILALPVIAIANRIMDLLVFTLSSVVLTICYIKFTKEIAYPGLVKQQNTA